MGTLIDWHIHCFLPEHRTDERPGDYGQQSDGGYDDGS